ncbi:glycogen debranching protein GlgX [Hoeflea sp.]|uniref:glycogen debranching protein GlgX n=1 Tax=Hoeflea sp. TaxID=1940281 RepID=UPI003BB10C34
MGNTGDDLTPMRLGASLTPSGARFAVHAPGAETISVCIFDAADAETSRHQLTAGKDSLFSGTVDGLKPGNRYGFRADGPWSPETGDRFDPAKLLVDPYAIRIDRPFAFDPRLAAFGEDTAPLMPKGVIEAPLPPLNPDRPFFAPGGLVYELPVRAFTMLHPEVPEEDRGTLKALAHPAVLDHLVSLNVGAVELLPVAAWIDERHLPRLGLANAWGYNPVTMLALDPRLAPGGIADLRLAVEALHGRGIGVMLDVVYNHTGESDNDGPTLSLRGLANSTYYRHEQDNPGQPVNDTGCGNTLACDRPAVQELVLTALRHFVVQAGIDGFRFDLAPILGRGDDGFSPDAKLLKAIIDDPVLHDRIMVAEPWDIGPGGYQLGNFQPPWLEWNDLARDDIRRFWRGDTGMTGALATRLSGSSDVFGHERARKTRSVNFVAAHDGFPLGDLVTYAHKHNEANGEDNRDGHDANHSWNNGVEGPSDDPEIRKARNADAKALIATLFASRGTLLLTAGDEFGHSQKGNNNAYAQDNEMTWRDWSELDRERLDFTKAWSALRTRCPSLSGTAFLQDADGSGLPDQVRWMTPDGRDMTPGDWENPELDAFLMVLGAPGQRLAVLFNRGHDPVSPQLPAPAERWTVASPGLSEDGMAPGRSVIAWEETAPDR